MAYNPGTYQEVLSTSYYVGTTEVATQKFNQYNVLYSSVNTKPNGKVRLINTSTEGPGYRIDVADARNIFQIGDIITVTVGGTPTVLSVKEIVTPEFTADSGKILSPQIITNDPIEVNPPTKRTYRFDISININEI